MNKNIEKVLELWQQHFKDEDKQYSEFEPSDVEYFVGCMLYNHFDFKNALDTMKTIDLSYDFLLAVEENKKKKINTISCIELEDELQKIEFLIDFLNEIKLKYTQDELYLLNRLSNHADGLKQRYNGEIEASSPDFVLPTPKSSNPLLR